MADVSLGSKSVKVVLIKSVYGFGRPGVSSRALHPTHRD